MIADFVPCSMIDYPGELAAVFFTQGCNLRCRYCHNPELCKKKGEKSISLDSAFAFLEKRTGKLGAVVLSGGEPTLHKELSIFLKTAGTLGYKTKLDTNGTNPDVVQKLIDQNLLNFVAVDFKMAPDENSKYLVGIENQAEKAIDVLSRLTTAGVECEARTTVLSGFHNTVNLKLMVSVLSSIGVNNWAIQPVRNNKVLDESCLWLPPDNSVLEDVIEYARSKGIEATLRTT